jgi:hypothetical protein
VVLAKDGLDVREHGAGIDTPAVREWQPFVGSQVLPDACDQHVVLYVCDVFVGILERAQEPVVQSEAMAKPFAGRHARDHTPVDHQQ